jgi:hypothetical protein
MNNNFPVYLSVFFILTTLGALLILGWVMNSSAKGSSQIKGTVLGASIIWLSIQGFLSSKNIYSASLSSFPPKLLILGILPPLLVIGFLFIGKSSRAFLDSLSLNRLIWLNIVRIPVEIALLLLFINKSVPRLMTLEGGNLDIISGLTVPVVAYYTFREKRLSYRFLLFWNILCLALLANIVVRAILSAPFPFQKLSFDQPNIAILNFPFVWLPTFIVPLILLGQITSIRQLMKMNRS